MQEGIYGLNQKKGRALPFSFLCQFIILCSCLLATTHTFAQDAPCYQFAVRETIQLDSLPVLRESIKMETDVPFQWNENGTAIIFSTLPEQDSITICFRKISSQFYQPYFLRDPSKYDAGLLATYQAKEVSALEEESLFSFGEIQSFGAITRGISFGNRQNIFVNSSLNLQMDGQLSEDLYLRAVITDQNVPYQPEGNTQQIRDFDNVYMEVYNDRFSAKAGDIVLENPVSEGYFLKYYKNVQGMKLSYQGKFDQWKTRMVVSGALAKGQFNSMVIQPIEGIQGPYKLRGGKNERFIIVIANSEKVYLDGRLLERGFDQDYVIDYNLGEITFSNNIVITQFSRIRVDFEYANQSYARSTFTASQELISDKATISVSYFRAKDNLQSTLGFELDEGDIDNLRNTNDNQAFISGVDSISYQENAILYAQKDTVDQDAQPTTIYVYSTDPDQAYYRVSFSDLGMGNGSYQLSKNTVNGKVYEWVGIGNGAYEPVLQIPTPNKQELVTIGHAQKITAHEQWVQELAISSQDQNLYNSQGQKGFAWKGGFRSVDRPISSLGKYLFSAAITYEFDQESFSYIDRFRSVDYDRNWQYDVFSDTLTQRQDQIFHFDVGLTKNVSNTLKWMSERRLRSGVVDGWQHELTANKELASFNIQTLSSITKNEYAGIQADWLKSKINVQWGLPILKPGYMYETEKQTSRIAQNDSIVSTLMYFDAHEWYVEQGDSSSVSYRLSYAKRADQIPVEGSMKPFTIADQVGIHLNTQKANQSFQFHLNYRKVDYQLSGEEDQNTLGRLNWSGTFIDQLISHRLQLATANSRELQRTFVFLQVPTGEGTHSWRDENNDGIQDLNEFYEAINEDEKNYVKIFTPTDEYLNAYQSTYLHTIDLRYPSAWINGGLSDFVSRFSWTSTIKYDFKTTENTFADRFDFFSFDIRESSVIQARNQVRHLLFYNRSAPGFGFEGSRTTRGRKSLLSGGFEVTQYEEWKTVGRFNFQQIVTLRATSAWQNKLNESDFLTTRNFEWSGHRYHAEMIWQPSNVFRINTSMQLKQTSTKDREDPSQADQQSYKLVFNWVKPGKSNFNASFEWISIAYSGEENTLLSYELLEALQPGQNQRWQANWQQDLGKGLQLSILYNGRNSADARPVHTGTMQLTAYF